MAIYQGADTMKATRAQSLWDVLQGQKRHTKKQDKQLGKKAIASTFGDILKTVVPGYGHVADVGIDMLSNKFLKMPEYEEEGGSFWGSKQISQYGEQADLQAELADPSLLESIIGNVGDYVGSEAGSKAIEGFDLSSLFAREGASANPSITNFVTPEGGHTVGDFSNVPMDWRNGGRVPKYENGGLLSKLKFGKKKKVPERDEALVALDAILSGGYEMKEGKHEYPMGYTQSQDWDQENGINLVRMISKFSTPEGERYYPGEGKSRSSSLGQTKAMMDAASRAYHSPADSITTDQLAKLKELGLFAGGGQVPQYYGGGSVSEGSPTIAGYFSQQGKTLGGSNTQSLAEKLGRK